MLSQEENELFTRVGPETPAGRMLRRYWQLLPQQRNSVTKSQKNEYVSWARIWYCSEIKAECTVLSASTAPIAGRPSTTDLSRRTASGAFIMDGSTILRQVHRAAL